MSGSKPVNSSVKLIQIESATIRVNISLSSCLVASTRRYINVLVRGHITDFQKLRQVGLPDLPLGYRPHHRESGYPEHRDSA